MIIVYEKGDPIVYTVQTDVDNKPALLELINGRVDNVISYDDEPQLYFCYKPEGTHKYYSKDEVFMSRKDAIEYVQRLLTARVTQVNVKRLHLEIRCNSTVTDTDQRELDMHEAYIAMYQKFLDTYGW
jgi:hypothetical protein